MRWLAFAVVAGIVGILGYLNTHTDETGILVGSILILGAIGGFVVPNGTWRAAILIGLAAPVSQGIAHLLGLHVPYPNDWPDILTSGVALVPAFAGTYLGALVRRTSLPDASSPTVRQ